MSTAVETSLPSYAQHHYSESPGRIPWRTPPSSRNPLGMTRLVFSLYHFSHPSPSVLVVPFLSFAPTEPAYIHAPPARARSFSILLIDVCICASVSAAFTPAKWTRIAVRIRNTPRRKVASLSLMPIMMEIAAAIRAIPGYIHPYNTTRDRYHLGHGAAIHEVKNTENSHGNCIHKAAQGSCEPVHSVEKPLHIKRFYW